MANIKNFSVSEGVLDVKVQEVVATFSYSEPEKRVKGDEKYRCITLYYTHETFKKPYPCTVFERGSKRLFEAAKHAGSLERDIEADKKEGFDTSELEALRPLVEALQKKTFFVHDLTFGKGVKFVPYVDTLTKDDVKANALGERMVQTKTVYDPTQPGGKKRMISLVTKSEFSVTSSDEITEDNVWDEIDRFGDYLTESQIAEANAELAEE